MTLTSLPRSPIATLQTLELSATEAPLLQAFFDANPAYFLATQGEPAGPGEGLDEITSQVPPEMSFTKKWVIGYAQADGTLAAMANVITDLMATGVFLIGTFIVATDRHGNGDAQRLYRGLEDWCIDNGAAWMRLGVVVGNARAERFWAAQGYEPVRPKPGITMGSRTVTVQTLVKPLAGGRWDDYFSLVPRDGPDNADAL